ncbi:MAG TPA: hypothetical protein ENN66_12145 [Proteobacteria bacterium]|nr:hypothetical protein [Pseudomonadota bacterium]
MSTQLSFTKFENELLPEFRNKINLVESEEDVKKFFVYTVQNLFTRVFSKKNNYSYADIALDPGTENGFVLGTTLTATTDFKALWENSDLPNIVGRLAKNAVKRCLHLEKHPEKTEAKIRM